jgi:drug/metabolite transporter (DMT)-like permease
MALTSRDALRGFAVSAVAGVFLAMTGAFGMDGAPLLVRLAYWIGLCVAGAVVGTGVSLFVGRDGRADEKPWLYGTLVCIGITLPFTIVVWIVSELVFEARRAWPPCRTISCPS